ncbi:MAG: radical SAM family heme chaperone HemW [Alphaproteobacteria bacterium]|jgi:oxygen-independent coproporphyrinogen-3 oxidase|nr:radical SAM family heme chaperone HemW [Alphaproteobacteria bacterium]
MKDGLKPYNGGEISLYFHWAYCTKKCPYCDFNSYVSKSIDYQAWLNGYLQSLKNQAKFFANKKITSIFFGGGTPSLMSPEMVFQLIDYCNQHNKSNGFNEVIEITLESNPSTFEIAKFKDFKQAGVNRLSTGIQSFLSESLKFLGRNHNVKEAILALEESNKIFDRVSFDLIIGLPNQTLSMWQKELNFALNFFKEHISIYQLTIEEGTPFFRQGIAEAKEEIGEELFLYTLETLQSKSIWQYEISNFAKKGAESIHNLNYWRGGEYLGIGANAHGRIFFNNNWYATKEYKNPKIWLEKSQITESSNNPIFEEFIEISNEDRFEEIVLTSLRTNEVLNPQIVNLLSQDKIQNLIENGLLEYKNSSIKTTNKGRLCLNYVINYLLT